MGLRLVLQRQVPQQIPLTKVRKPQQTRQQLLIHQVMDTVQQRIPPINTITLVHRLKHLKIQNRSLEIDIFSKAPIFMCYFPSNTPINPILA